MKTEFLWIELLLLERYFLIAELISLKVVAQVILFHIFKHQLLFIIYCLKHIIDYLNLEVKSCSGSPLILFLTF